MPTKKQILVKKKFTSWTLCRTFIVVYLLIWPLQAWAAVLCLLGFVGMLGIDTSKSLQVANWLVGDSAISLSIGLYLLGGLMTLLIQFSALVITAFFYLLLGIDAWKGHGLVLIPVILSLCMIPILNLFPLIWGWWVYVSVSNNHS